MMVNDDDHDDEDGDDHDGEDGDDDAEEEELGLHHPDWLVFLETDGTVTQ